MHFVGRIGKIVVHIGVVFAVLLLISGFCSADYSEPLSITFTPPEKPDGELLFTFSLPMVTQDKLETAVPPTVVFEPDIAGEFTWRWEDELVFTPHPGKLPRGRRVRITILGAAPLAGEEYALTAPWQMEFAAPGMVLAGKVANWPMVQGRPRFMDILNWHSGWVGRGPLFLLYDQSVDVEQVQRLLTVKGDYSGRTLDIDVFRPENAQQVFSGDLDLENLVAVRILGLPETNRPVSMSIPSWKDAEKPEFIQKRLEVNASFKLKRSSPGHYYREYDYDRDERADRIPLRTSWYFEFNNRFNPDLLRQAFHIEPEPEDVSVYGIGWTGTRIYLRLEPGTRYHMSIDRSFMDILGNPLDADVDVSFKSQDLPPQLTIPRGPLLLEREASRIPIRVRNVVQIEMRVFRFDAPEDFINAVEQHSATRDDDFGFAVSARDFGFTEPGELLHVINERFESNTIQMLDLPLNVAPGLLAIEVRAFGSGSEAEGALTDVLLVQSTDFGITAKVAQDTIFAWVTRLKTAVPVAGAHVSLYDEDGELITDGETDEAGGIYLDAPEFASRAGLKKAMYLVAEKLGYMAVAHLKNEELTQAWMFNLQSAVDGIRKLPAAVFSERGAYRPGETVHLKCVVNPIGKLPEQSVLVRIKDPKGQQVVRRELALDRYGSAHLGLPLKEKAPVGSYLVQVSTGDQRVTSAFLVEEYRIPTFQVKVSSEQDSWTTDAESQAVVQAEYLHGGSLGARGAQWEVLRTPAPFTSAFFPNYLFDLGEALGFAGTIASGKDHLDSQGRIPLSFRADHPAVAGPMRYMVEAAVTDVDRQTYSGRLGRVIHSSEFYVGALAPSRSVLTTQDTLQVSVVAVNASDGAPRECVPMHVSLERLDYHTTSRMSREGLVQMLNRAVPVKQQQCDVLSEEAPVACEFRFPRAGLYLVRASAQNSAGQHVQAGFQVVASGREPTAWPRFDRERIEIVTDKATYQIGDTARLVVQSPYKQAHGLLTVERDGILTHQVFTITDDTPAVELPITADFAPNAYASVVLLRGRIHHEKDASGFETGAPGFKIGYASLEIDPSQQRLAVDVQPAQTTSHPGKTLNVMLQVRDADGEPASGQATVMVVDEAVLGLTGYRTPEILEKLYVTQALGVRTGTSILDLPHARRSRNETVFPGGDQDSALLMFGDDPESLRKLFKSTAYWNPEVAVADDGTAAFAVELPDNLTTYRIMAVVSDEKGRAGSADSQVQVRKPLMIQPVVPRFLYPDDELRVDAQVFNQTGESGDVRLQVRFEGLNLLEGEDALSLPIAEEQSVLFRFPVAVSGKEEAVLRFTAERGEFSDAVEVRLPILTPGNQRTINSSISVLKKETLQVALPADRIPGSARLEVVTSTTALSELKDSVQYLMRYPNGCIEQTTSTAYPLVVLKDLLPEIGIDVDMEDLKRFSEAGIKRILSFQTPSGGLSYWPGSSEPHAFATAFGLTALIEAKHKGYNVPDEALAGTADYLERVLKQGDITGEMPHGGMADADTRALFVMTLGRLGRPQPGYISVLWNQREKLTAFGLSFLALAAKELPNEHALLENILTEIRNAAEEEELEAYYAGQAKGGWSFDSPLRTHGASLLAFAESGGDSEMTAKFLKGLLHRRKGGLWGNTQENVFGIMGVHAAATQNSSGPASASMQLFMNGKNVDLSAMERSSDRVSRLSLDESELRLAQNAESIQEVTLLNSTAVPIFLTARARYEVPLKGEYRQAQANGFTITRRYETLEGIPLEEGEIPLGTLVRVRLHVQSPAGRHYVAIDDKLPAGLEPLNMNLATTAKVEMGELNAVRQRSLSVLSYHEIRDSRVAFYVDEMLPGECEFVYVARATTPGRFLRPAGRVEAMYQPEIYGTTSVDEVNIVEK